VHDIALHVERRQVGQKVIERTRDICNRLRVDYGLETFQIGVEVSDDIQAEGQGR
jgi:hypothetical protein